MGRRSNSIGLPGRCVLIRITGLYNVMAAGLHTAAAVKAFMLDFVAPDWSAPADTAQRLSALTPEHKCKGTLFLTPIKQAQKVSGKTPGKRKYSPLTSYPVSELIEVMVESAQLIYPNMSQREGFRRIGRTIFPALNDTAAGTFLFSVAAGDFYKAVKLISRAYSLFTCISAKAKMESENTLIVEMRNAWVFPDCYQVGVFEGALATYGKSVEVLVKRHSICDLDLKMIVSDN